MKLRLRLFYLLIAWGLAFTQSLRAAVPPVAGPAPGERPAVVAAADRVESSIAGGITFLISQQLPNGAIADAWLGSKYQTALTSLAILSFAAAGHHPADKTEEGVALRRAIYFVTRQDRQTRDGYFGWADNSTMFGHAITTLALIEISVAEADWEQNELLRAQVGLALGYIIRAQGQPKIDRLYVGGWRYELARNDSDVPISVWQLLALQASAKAGTKLPPNLFPLAANYLKGIYWQEHGVFGYGPHPIESTSKYRKTVATKYIKPDGKACYSCHIVEPGITPVAPSLLTPPMPRNNFSTTAAGLIGLRLCQQGNTPEATATANFLVQILNNDPTGQNLPNGPWPFHGLFLATLALGNNTTPQAQIIRQYVERNLPYWQYRDSSWTDNFEGRHVGRVYCTSMAVLSLAAKYHRLTIYNF